MKNMIRSIYAMVLLLISMTVLASPPYDMTVNFDPPASGATPSGYNLYIDDCAASGATAAPFASVTDGQTFAGALTADGIFDVCVRSVNATGEQPDPGPVATIDVADLPLPGPIQNLDISIACPNGGCSVTVNVTP